MPKYFEHSASPLYAQVADAMRERIVKSIWAMDTQIPTLPTLAQEFGVGLVTVRQAVQLLKHEQLLAPKQGQGTFVISKPETHPRMKVESSLRALADLYRKQAPKLIPIEESFATPKLDPDDGKAAPIYRLLRRIHASERQVTSVISAYIDERVFRLAPKRFRKETVIPVLLELPEVQIGTARQILTISTALGIAKAIPSPQLLGIWHSPNQRHAPILQPALWKHASYASTRQIILI